MGTNKFSLVGIMLMTILCFDVCFVHVAQISKGTLNMNIQFEEFEQIRSWLKLTNLRYNQNNLVLQNFINV